MLFTRIHSDVRLFPVTIFTLHQMKEILNGLEIFTVKSSHLICIPCNFVNLIMHLFFFLLLVVNKAREISTLAI